MARLAASRSSLLVVDLRLFAPRSRADLPRGRRAGASAGSWSRCSSRRSCWALSSGQDAVTYLTVYSIERSLSLDNLFVFLLLFGYFGVPSRDRAKLLFWGIVAALALRGLAILGGVALIERFDFVIYVLGAR